MTGPCRSYSVEQDCLAGLRCLLRCVWLLVMIDDGRRIFCLTMAIRGIYWVTERSEDDIGYGSAVAVDVSRDSV